MRTDTENLVHMASRIGEFFQAMPDRDEALREIAQHLHKFWAPRMRIELLAHVDAGGAGLLQIVRDAVVEHRASLLPVGARDATLGQKCHASGDISAVNCESTSGHDGSISALPGVC